MPTLLISVRFHEGRYHGSGEWPPSPARLFQALVAGAARGENLSANAVQAFEWLESLEAPAIAVPSANAGQGVKTFVPNNDLDAVGGDPARIGEIRAGKFTRPRIFDAAIALVYAWAFENDAEVERHAHTICEIADTLYQLGRGIDMAWAQGEIVEEGKADVHLRASGSILWRPSQSGDGTALASPHRGSLASLSKRFKAARARFKPVGTGKKASQLFLQAPKPSFGPVLYNSASTFLLFDIKNADNFASQSLAQIVQFTESVRDVAEKRLKASAWRLDDPKRDACIEKTFVGREAKDADKARRIRITPLPSIGYMHTNRSIRRVAVEIPPDCPIASDDIAWAFSSLTLKHDKETGEVFEELVPAADRAMLGHYGIETKQTSRLWRTVTPAALSPRAARRRIDPQRMHEEAKGGAERLREHAAAEIAVRQALRHAGVNAPVGAVRVQCEPFEAKGLRAEAFANSPRFAKERLWHVEIEFAYPVPGPLLIGDGRYLGLGLMAPVLRHINGVLAFTITDGLAEQADPLGLTRALRRAVMARVQETLGERTALPAFFTGHAPDGKPARSGQHEHLAFVFDVPRKRLLIIAPHILEHRAANRTENRHLHTLEEALADFRELRAGSAGKLSLVSSAVDLSCDPLFAPSLHWESQTPYRVTRHAKLNDATAALETDLATECLRAGLPQPQIEIIRTFAKSDLGLFGFAKLKFNIAVTGPLLLGRDRHCGGGLFEAAE